MMNFNNFKIENVKNYGVNYDTHFSYKIGEEKRLGSIYFDPKEVRVYADFKNSPEEILVRDDFRFLPNGEVEVINYSNDAFIIGDKLSSEQEEFLDFLKNNGMPVTPEEGEEWYWKLYHNKEWFGDYTKSSL